MKVSIIRTKYTFYDPAVGLVFHAFGVRIMLIWWHIIIRP